ncbi:MAG: sigma-70 family RNA polymerase sigma factor [Eubacterium sp.]|nr:sigma-70 family RNA polymerase sigma factor [Eubacterium sp.]
MTKNYDDFTDEELIVRLRGGEADIEDFLMNKYKYLVRKKARVLFLEGGDTEDLLQEGMWGLFKAIREYQPDRGASFATFADVCVRRQLYSAIAAAGRNKHRPLNESLSLSEMEENKVHLSAGPESDPEYVVLREEEQAELQKKVWEALSPLEKKVLELYLSGMDYLQIAEKLGRTGKSIDNALQRIRNKIKALR